MPKVLALIPAILLVGACASHAPSDQQAAAAATATAAESQAASGPPPEWQKKRQQYTDCAREKAEARSAKPGTTQAVVNDALRDCRGELDAVRTSFREYLDGQMSSAHGKRSARQAADRVGRDTEDKVRAYLLRHVEYHRAVAARQ